MNMQVNPQELGLDPAPLLSVAGVSRFYGERIGCADVSFDLWPGEVLGIVGESGSGKSTLLRCLAGIDKPDEGEVLFRGGAEPLDIYSVAEQERRRLMRTAWGIVHQNPRDGLRMDVSAGGNVGERLMDNGARHYGRIRETALDWLQRVEIAGNRIDDRPRQFSGGMQQRLQIARCLAQEPRLLLMDEPFGALDAMTRQSLQDEILSIAASRDMTVLFVTHDLEEAIYLGDQVIALDANPGRVDRVIDVALPTPRDQLTTREDAQFVRLRRELHGLMHKEAA